MRPKRPSKHHAQRELLEDLYCLAALRHQHLLEGLHQMLEEQTPVAVHRSMRELFEHDGAVRDMSSGPDESTTAYCYELQVHSRQDT